VKRLAEAIRPDGVWEKPVWAGIEPLTLGEAMGEKPDHFPLVQARLGYDEAALAVIFRVEDQYVLARAGQHQDIVCTDSCVEFFFAPGKDISAGYFNLEMNGGGIMLFHFQTIPRRDAVALDPDRVARVEVAHSLPSTVDPEIAEPVTWTVEYRLPVAALEGFCPIDRPAAGVVWRANFFKCADASSHPHWLTWATVNRPQPDFHVPGDFGQLVFE
jgi:hypothetical protein